MSREHFHVKEHVFSGQHIREYPRATAHSQEEVLKLCAKQYIPKNNPTPHPGDVTIVSAHANGFVKELYEPLWDDLLVAAAKLGIRIRSIWIADVAWQGQSGILNEANLGNDPSWHDHSRDLLQMINTFRREMSRPLVGIGHSFGGTILTYLALMHPRLLTSLVLLDPVLGLRMRGPDYGHRPLELSAVRRDLWPSRDAAAAAFRRSKFYATWDTRVLDLWIQHGLRELPTRLFPDKVAASPTSTNADSTDKPVTLTTTKHMEVFTFLRPMLQGVDIATGKRIFDRSRIRDVSDDAIAYMGLGHKLYRPEVPNTAEQLPHLRPGVCYVFGSTSAMSMPEFRREKLELTGIGGVGGSGGVPAGRVRGVVLEGTGHLVAMEKPAACAEHAAAWIEKELELWRAEERELEVSWWSRADADKQHIDAEWASFIDRTPRDKPKL